MEKQHKKILINVLQLICRSHTKIRQTKPEKLKKGLKFDRGRLCSQPFRCKFSIIKKCYYNTRSSQSCLCGQSYKQQLYLTPPNYEPCLNSTHVSHIHDCKLCTFHIPVSGQHQLRTIFLLPESICLWGL